MKLFNHVQIKVVDLNQSKAFYKKIMAVLGYSVVLEIEGSVVGFGTSVNDMFELRQASDEAPRSQSVHIAFNAESQAQVDAFYHEALAAGAVCHGRPGLRPNYAKDYYAAFVLDLDGHNIEAVFVSDV